MRERERQRETEIDRQSDRERERERERERGSTIPTGIPLSDVEDYYTKGVLRI